MAAMSWDAARESAHAAATPLKPRSIPLGDAGGTVLATPLVAPAAVPPVDRAAMDGYAVSGDGPWRVIGSVFATSDLSGPLSDGEAKAIVTGAAVPPGTTAVLREEDATLTADLVLGTVHPGSHIRRAGEECQAGEVLLRARVVIDPPVLGLAAALGLDRLTVIPHPQVLTLITGDELIHRGPSTPGRVRDAIGPMLPGLISRAGALPTITHLPDNRDVLIEALNSATADLVLVSGSSASGPADHLRGALIAVGAELLVDGVACRPGHPQALARLGDGRLVIGLPGNPLAALTAFLTLGVAVIQRLRGLQLPVLPPAAVPGGIACHPHNTRLVPVRVGPQGVVPVGHSGSAMLRGVAAADALAVIDPGPSEAIAARLLPLDPGARFWGS
jgi:molybdopterin molybdotransferase